MNQDLISYDSEFQGMENVCNWCGSDEIKFVGCSYFGPHPHHMVYECKKCHKHSWFHLWWSKCYKIKNGKFRGR